MKADIKPLIKNIGIFSVNRIGELVQTYTDSHGGDFYNFGWGDIATDMVQHKIPKILFPPDVICKYPQPEGLPILIKHIAEFINRLSDIKINPRNILITNGATNAIVLLSYYFREFHGARDILVQNPTYDTALNIFRSQHYKIYGTNPNLTRLKDIKFNLAYCSFKFHNPTGLYLPPPQADTIKKELLTHGYFIEDDAYGLFADEPTIDLVEHPRYVYVGSFSKYIFPGIRMGYVIANAKIIECLKIIQKYHNSHPNMLSQIMLLHYLKQDLFLAEIKERKKLLNEKRGDFWAALPDSIKETIENRHGGFYYWIKLRAGTKSIRVFADLLKNNVFVIPGDIYFVDVKNSYSAIRISVSPMPKSKISRGAHLLGKHLMKYVP